MSPLHERARQVFDAVVDRKVAERDRALAEACGADATLRQCVELLLADHDGAQAAFQEPQVGGEAAGDQIGPYRLLEVIGEGGFGTVWMAEQQQPIRRKVALKIVKWGMDTRQVVARFEAERQALALMDHPHIARVLDGGATASGRPYFAMELVRGVPITRYCDEARLTPRERIALLVPVCEAVQHAHQKGVIHRDLKPSNVLVTLHDGKPVPKVIDFGIAKATAGQLTDKTVFTGFRQMLGTPEYMAPEQAEMSGLDVDTRADIYSLGVLLYELLTGTKPFELKEVLEAGWQEMVRHIREVDPVKPSTRVSTLGARVTEIATRRRMLPKGLSHAFRGDLDWIVLKALEKERGRRYETAHALAEDLERHLGDEPVLASPPRPAYRLRKYLRRHRLAVAAAAAVALSLLTGAAAAGWGYLRAEDHAVAAVRAADRARAQAEQTERESSKTRSVLDLVRTMLQGSHPGLGRGHNYPLRLLLADFAATTFAGTPLDPVVESALRSVVGCSYLGLGLLDRSAPHLERALELQRALHDARHLDLARALRDLADLRRQQWRRAEAQALLQEAQAALPADDGVETRQLRAGLLLRRGALSSAAGRGVEAEAAIREAIALVPELPGAASGSAVSGLLLLGENLAAQGRWPAAEDQLQQGLTLATAQLGPDHLAVADAWSLLAELHAARGDLDGAEALQQQALAGRKALVGARHPQVAVDLDRLGLLRRQRGDLPGALELHEQARHMRQELLGADHPAIAMSWNNLGLVAQARGELQAAEEQFQRALALERANNAEDSPAIAIILSNLASLAAEKGELATAEDLHRQALALRRRLSGADHPDVAESLQSLAQVLQQRGDLREARSQIDTAIAMHRGRADGEHPLLVAALGRRGSIQWADGDTAGAEASFREALTAARRLLGERHRDFAMHLGNLVWTLEHRGILGEATERQREKLGLVAGQSGAPSAVAAGERAILARLLLRQQQWGEAESLARTLLPGDVAQHQAAALLAWSLAGQGRHADAVAPLLEAGELWHARAATILAHDGEMTALLWCLDALGRRQEAARWRLRLAGRLSAHGESREKAGRVAAATESARLAAALLQADASGETGIEPGAASRLAMLRAQLGGQLFRLGCGDAAEPLLRASLDSLRDEPGRATTPGDVGTVATLLGQVLMQERRAVDAEPLFRAAIACSRQLTGAPPQRLASELSHLGAALLAQDRGAEAEPILREDVELWRAAVGDAHPSLAQSLANLADALASLGRHPEAVQQQQLAVAALRRADGDQQAALASHLARLALRLLDAGQATAAEPPARESLELRARQQAETQEHHLSRATLGRVLSAQGRWPEAERLLVEAGTHLTGPQVQRPRRQCIDALIALYRAQGLTAEARAWELKLADGPGTHVAPGKAADLGPVDASPATRGAR